MIDHRSAIELAAAAVDFVLDDAERRRLDEHLAGCPSCRAEAQALRGDGAALAALPAIAPPTWVRRVIGRRRGPRRAFLLVAAALVLMSTVGAALAIGAVLRNQRSPDVSPSFGPSPTRPLVSPGPSVAVSPSVLPSPAPSGGPLAVPTQTTFPPRPGRRGWVPAPTAEPGC